MKPNRLTGGEYLDSSQNELIRNTVLDFWQWAFSDLRSNDIRGVFAEWLVAKLLDIPLSVRDSWAEWDLIMENGIKIEVKASAYLQTWKQKQPSRIVFSGLCGRKLNAETNQYAPISTYNADLYVFCVQIEKNTLLWNALDLNQWRFYLLTKNQLAQYKTKSISLKTLAAAADELTADGFCQYAKIVIESIRSANISRII
ncbi:MAG: hypothetical protein AB1656_01470 [Candidatus Omnitrophota bacterium]